MYFPLLVLKRLISCLLAGIMAESNVDANAELYEYDAPSQVVDLKELQNAECDDRWFGKFSFLI